MIILDIETVPQDEYLHNPQNWFSNSDFAPRCKLGNLKDADKIKAKEAEWEAKGGKIKDLSVEIWTAKPICIGYATEHIETDLTMREIPLTTIFRKIQHSLPLITFNGKHYDLPLLAVWCAKCGWTDLAKGFRALVTSDYDIATHIDLATLPETKGRFMSLDILGKFLGVEAEKYGEGSEIFGWYYEGEWEKIQRHCEADIELTRKCAERLGVV